MAIKLHINNKLKRLIFTFGEGKKKRKRRKNLVKFWREKSCKGKIYRLLKTKTSINLTFDAIKKIINEKR